MFQRSLFAHQRILSNTKYVANLFNVGMDPKIKPSQLWRIDKSIRKSKARIREWKQALVGNTFEPNISPEEFFTYMNYEKVNQLILGGNKWKKLKRLARGPQADGHGSQS